MKAAIATAMLLVFSSQSARADISLHATEQGLPSRNISETPPKPKRQPAEIQSRIDMDFAFKTTNPAMLTVDACSGTLASRKEKSPGICEAAFLTAGHCVRQGRRSFDEIHFRYIGKKSVSNSQPDFKIASTQTRTETPVDQSADLDYAVVFVTTACSNLSSLTPAPLAETDSQGNVVLKTGDAIATRNRSSAVGGNPGGGARISTQVDASRKNGFLNSQYFSPQSSDQINGGDSGSGIENSNGELVGVVASSSDGNVVIQTIDVATKRVIKEEQVYKPEIKNKDFYFAPGAIGFLAKKLTEAGMPFEQGGHSGSEHLSSRSAVASAPDLSSKMEHGGFMAAPAIGQGAGSRHAGQPSEMPSSRGVLSSTNTTTSVAPTTAVGGTPGPLGGTSGVPQGAILSGQALPGYNHVRTDGLGRVLAKTANGGWEVTKIFDDGRIGVANGQTIHEDSLKELAVAYDASQNNAQHYGARIDLVRHAVAYYQKDLPGWKQQIASQHVLTPAPGMTGGTGGSGGLPGPGGQLGQPTPFGRAFFGGQARYAFCTEGNYSDADIRKYEGLTYQSGHARERYDYPKGVFADVPEGGTGKIILAYFGDRQPALEQRVAGNPVVEVRNYAANSLESEHAKFFTKNGITIQALGVDGLGRKITRYSQNPMAALESLLRSEEVNLFQRYLCAKQAKQPATSIARSVPSVPVDHGFAGPVSFETGQLGGFLNSNCVRCHNSVQAPQFPAFLGDWAQWESLLKQGDGAALAWLKSLNSKVVHGRMLEEAGISRSQGAQDFKKFIDQVYKRFTNTESTIAKDRLGSAQAVSMIDQNKSGEYAAVLRAANIGDPELKKQLLEFDAIWDEAGNPSYSWAASAGDSGRSGARPVRTMPPSGLPGSELFYQDNRGYHWREPFDDTFAIDRNTRGLEKVTLIRFPRDANGNIVKGIAGTERHNREVTNMQEQTFGQNFDQLDSIWGSFPPGTRVFEVLYSKRFGQPVVVDIMTREKRLTSDASQALWVPDALRPDSSPQAIEAWIASQPDATTNKDFETIRQALYNPVRDAVGSQLGAQYQGGYPFIVNGQRTGQLPGTKSVLPAGSVSMETLKRMYEGLQLTSATGSSGWQLEAQDMFSGSHRGIAVNTQNCLNCHRSAGEAFRDVFGTAGLDPLNLRAYGNMSGYDGVLSAPWFSPQVLAQYNGRVGQYANPRPPITMRDEWRQFFENYDPSKHSPQVYRRTEKLPSSDNPLRGYASKPGTKSPNGQPSL